MLGANSGDWNLDEAPLVVIWEITRACALACKHCRADATVRRDPNELTFEEGCRILDQTKAFGSPVVVLTGGDPLLRPDFTDLIRYGTSLGLRISGSPSGTKLVTREAMTRLAEAGLRRVQFSLDGSCPEIHDSFRRVKGSFKWTMDGLQYAKEAGMELQIGTTVSRYSLDDMKRIAEIAERIGCTLWNVFFLVPTGRGQSDDMISPEEGERVLNWLWDLSGSAPFTVKATEAPFYRRVARQRSRLAPTSGVPSRPEFRTSPAPGLVMPGRLASFGINAGKGFMFIDHTGEVFPSGFLPVSAGNVRQHTLSSIYRDSAVFRELRDPDLLTGKCGLCEYRKVCGGSRARAYGLTGDYLASDPQCVYVPEPLKIVGAPSES